MKHRPLFVAVVDDDEDVRFSLTALFRSSGSQVESFRGAEDFLASSAAADCDCVVSDIQMPGVDGLELLRELKRRKPDLPVVLVSAFATEAIRRHAKALDAFCLLEKPFDPDDLLDRVRLAAEQDRDADEKA